jgi:tetratricopeptide (TPR) repeat protein
MVPELARLAAAEEVPAWRATLVGLLAPWSDRTEAKAALAAGLRHESPMVRAAAVRALEASPEAAVLVQPLRRDPVRLVRLDAILTGLARGEPVGEGREEFDAYLAAGSDQPAGALRQANVALAENRLEDAERWIRKAVRWDAGSAVPQHTLGRVLNVRGRNAAAESAFARAVALDSANAEHRYALGLLYAEMGRLPDAVTALEKAVALEPRFGRAWYNLGLAYAQQERLDKAIEALERAEDLMPGSPDPPYARATVHARLGDDRGAREAMQEAMERGGPPPGTAGGR